MQLDVKELSTTKCHVIQSVLLKKSAPSPFYTAQSRFSPCQVCSSVTYGTKVVGDKKLSCRREAAQFVLNHSRLLNVIQNDTLEEGV